MENKITSVVDLKTRERLWLIGLVVSTFLILVIQLLYHNLGVHAFFFFGPISLSEQLYFYRLTQKVVATYISGYFLWTSFTVLAYFLDRSMYRMSYKILWVLMLCSLAIFTV